MSENKKIKDLTIKEFKELMIGLLNIEEGLTYVPIYMANDELNVSASTLYNKVNDGSIDFKRTKSGKPLVNYVQLKAIYGKRKKK